MKLKSIAIPAVALFVGIGIGASDDPVVAAPAAAKPKVVTKTVEVPGPERVVEKAVVPVGCTEAIEHARAVAAGVVVFTDAVVAYPPLVGRAWQAGLTSDTVEAESIIAEMETANSGIDGAADTVGPAVAAFNAAAAECRA